MKHILATLATLAFCGVALALSGPQSAAWTDLPTTALVTVVGVVLVNGVVVASETGALEREARRARGER